MKVYSTAGEQALMQERRDEIASLLCRGVTSLRKIQAALDEVFKGRADAPGHSHQTVSKDIKAIETEWRKRCAAKVDDHRARLLACYWDIYDEARQKEQLDTAMGALGSIGVMLGANAAPKAAVDEKGAVVKYIYGVPPDAI